MEKAVVVPVALLGVRGHSTPRSGAWALGGLRLRRLRAAAVVDLADHMGAPSSGRLLWGEGPAQNTRNTALWKLCG